MLRSLLILFFALAACAHALPEVVEAELETFVLERMAAWDTPGLALVVVEGGEVVLSRGYGVADMRTGRPMTEDTLVMLGSTTKAMTALALMQLVEAGEVELDAPVERYLPWFAWDDPRGQAITLRQLLTHSSGMPWGRLFTGREQAEELSAYVRSLQSVRLEAAPGERFGYSNDTFTILGLIVQEVTGTPYERYLQENLFDPLGMTRTTFDLARAREAGLAAGHRNEYGVAAPYRLSYTDSENPAGRAMTSARELGPYLAMLLAGGRAGDAQILKSATLETMWTPIIRADEAFDYGLAWYLGELGGLRLVTHPGSTGTSGSRFSLLPEAGLAVGVLSNVSRPSDPREEIASSLLIASLLFGEAPFAPPPLPAPEALEPIRPEALIGDYSSAAGPVRIALKGAQLVGSVAEHAFTLEPHGHDGFVLQSDLDRLDGLLLVFVPADPDRPAWLAGSDRLELLGEGFAFRSD